MCYLKSKITNLITICYTHGGGDYTYLLIQKCNVIQVIQKNREWKLHSQSNTCSNFNQINWLKIQGIGKKV